MQGPISNPDGATPVLFAWLLGTRTSRAGTVNGIELSGCVIPVIGLGVALGRVVRRAFLASVGVNRHPVVLFNIVNAVVVFLFFCRDPWINGTLFGGWPI